MEIEIVNFEKYNPRKDYSTGRWIRLDSCFYEDEKFFKIDHRTGFIFIKLLCLRQKKQKPISFENISWLETILEEKGVLQCVDELSRRRLIQVTQSNIELPIGEKSYRSDSESNLESPCITNEHNEHNEHNEDKQKQSPNNIINKESPYNIYYETWNKYIDWVLKEQNVKLSSIQELTEARIKNIKRCEKAGLTIEKYREALTCAAEYKDKTGEKFYMAGDWFNFDWMFRIKNSKGDYVCNWENLISKKESSND